MCESVFRDMVRDAGRNRGRKYEPKRPPAVTTTFSRSPSAKTAAGRARFPSLKQTAHLHYYVLLAGYNLQSIHFWVCRWWYNHSKPQILKQLIQHPAFEDVVMGIYKKMRRLQIEVQADGGGEEEVSEELRRCRSKEGCEGEKMNVMWKKQKRRSGCCGGSAPDSSTKCSQ